MSLGKERYEAIVVGSGFGGAVTACRLAQAGVDVAILERGRRFAPGEFPRHPVRSDLMLWHHGGPYDVRPLNDVCVVQGAGYGGGSLVYANVQIRPPSDAFDGGWPAAYSRTTLDPYYDLVAHMLDITPVQADPSTGELPPKTRVMEAAAERLGRDGQFFHPNIAVRFDGAGETTPNKFGVPQSGCLHCGDCDIGCNVGAKNTLDLNYLAVAEQRGAEAATDAEVNWLAPAEDGFRVRFRDRGEGGGERTVAASQVLLCMGAVNSTELLLRCRDQHGTLPRLSEKLGTGYSANGDFIAFGSETPSFAANDGPTITTNCVYDVDQDGGRTRLTVQEGGYSAQFAHALPFLHPVRLAEDAGRDLGARLSHYADRLDALLHEVGDATAALLVMGRDSGTGTIELVRPHHRMRIRFDTASNAALYAVETAACREFIGALGGRFALAPNWTFLGQPFAPHNLGGCPMAEDAGEGVVDPNGAVFGYPGLHVLDGAIVPAALGVNPSHTIAAVAERCIEATIRSRPGQERWRAPEAADASRISPPEDRVSIPPGGTAPPAVTGGGLIWKERMTGTCELAGAARTARFAITVVVPDVVAFVSDRAHPGRVTGRVRVDGLTGPDGAAVEAGTFHLFLDEGDPAARAMSYSLPFRDVDGRPWVLLGRKDVRGRTILDFWRATTTLHTRIERMDDRGTRAVGTLRIGALAVARMGVSMRGVGGARWSDRFVALWGFARFFATTLARLYVAGRRATTAS